MVGSITELDSDAVVLATDPATAARLCGDPMPEKRFLGTAGKLTLLFRQSSSHQNTDSLIAPPRPLAVGRLAVPPHHSSVSKPKNNVRQSQNSPYKLLSALPRARHHSTTIHRREFTPFRLPDARYNGLSVRRE
jgi:hypothetical protein